MPASGRCECRGVACSSAAVVLTCPRLLPAPPWHAAAPCSGLRQPGHRHPELAVCGGSAVQAGRASVPVMYRLFSWIGPTPRLRRLPPSSTQQCEVVWVPLATHTPAPASLLPAPFPPLRRQEPDVLAVATPSRMLADIGQVRAAGEQQAHAGAALQPGFAGACCHMARLTCLPACPHAPTRPPPRPAPRRCWLCPVS